MDAIEYEQARFSPEEQEVLRWVKGQEENMLELLQEIVLINTGSQNTAGLNKLQKRLAGELRLLGFKTETLPGGEFDILGCNNKKLVFDDHLVARMQGDSGNRIMLSGHMDTVFGREHEFQEIKFEENVIKGPGALDMKGGIVVMLYALKALHNNGYLQDRHITVILNSDEEMGSLSSRGHIEKLAKAHDFGLVFEGTHNNNHSRARKGLGQIRLLTRGKAAHAGAAHSQGVSAIKEMAHKIVEIENLTDYEEQVTLNVGVVNGGSARNTIPSCADMYVDLRYQDNQQGKDAIDAIRDIAARTHTGNQIINERPHTEVWASLHRPAKLITEQSDRMLSMYLGISASNGILARSAEYLSGGGTDGSLMQFAGLPTMDSLGVDGAYAHSPREFAHKASFVPRAQSAAIFIMRLMETGLTSLPSSLNQDKQ